MANNLAVNLEYMDLSFEYPEEYNPSDSNAENFIEILKKINKMPFNKGTYYYSDNLWDFSQYNKLNINRKSLRFNFGRCCETFRDDLKNYVLIKILDNTSKIQTVNKEFGTLCSFFNFAEDDGFYDVRDITANEISKFFEANEDKSLPTILWFKSTIKKFYECYSANFTDILTKNISKLFDNDNPRAMVAHKEANKMDDIPKDYFDGFMSACIKIANDAEETKLFRGIACLYIIMSQTGLRIGECLGLEAGSLDEIKIFNGEATHYLNYKTWKREHGNNTYSNQKTYANELTVSAYKILMDIYKEDRQKHKLTNLYLGSDRTITTKTYPIEPSTFSRVQLGFCAHLDKYFKVLDLDENKYPELIRKDAKIYKEVMRIAPNAKTLTIPHNHQFRVHVCTEMYNKGVPLKYIEKFMSHLSHEMEGYYVRPTKQNPQENMNFSIETLKQIVSKEVKPLGGKSSLVDKIDEFISANGYNVATDLDEICQQLSKKIPIRQKTGGVCIKSSMLRECSHDAQTNEFFCAYGVCPNIFHFFYMADISYRQCKELEETIAINKKNGFNRQVQKETIMLNNIVSNKLLPELDELKTVIESEGAESILFKYPDLQHIVEHFDEIYKEASVWKEMK